MSGLFSFIFIACYVLRFSDLLVRNGQGKGKLLLVMHFFFNQYHPSWLSVLDSVVLWQIFLQNLHLGWEPSPATGTPSIPQSTYASGPTGKHPNVEVPGGPNVSPIQPYWMSLKSKI